MTQPSPQLLPGTLDLSVLQLLHGEPTNGRKHLAEQWGSWARCSNARAAFLRAT
jgi:hypothetical protein